MKQRRHWQRLLMVVPALLAAACASAPPPEPVPRNAFFIATPKDAAAYRELAREQESGLPGCSTTQSCDRAHFLIALISLYENQEVAAKHFHAVLTIAPTGRYAASSLQWIRLLENGRDGSQYQAALSQAAERLVRDVLERETAVVSQSAEARQKDAQAVHSLKRQLKAREKKIDELTQQIDALKRVDQEVKDQVKPSRPAN